jgi:tetratricopeptide (TPR) repeat protein
MKQGASEKKIRIRDMERYIENDLNPEAVTVLEQRLTEDVEARKGLRLSLHIEEVLADQDMHNMKNTLEKMHEKYQQEKYNARKKLYRIAASFTLLILASSLFIIRNTSQLNQKIIKEHYKAYPSVVHYRDNKPVLKGDFSLAMDYYQAGKYENALVLFNRVAVAPPYSFMKNFYSAICYFELSRTSEAISELEKNLSKKNHYFYQQSLWFLSLFYIDMKDYEKALPYLQELNQTKGTYQSKAEEILTRIQK